MLPPRARPGRDRGLLACDGGVARSTCRRRRRPPRRPEASPPRRAGRWRASSRRSSVPRRAGRIPIGIAGAVWSCRGACAVRPTRRPLPGTMARPSSGHSAQRLPLWVPRRRRTMATPAPNPRRSANRCPVACGPVRRVAASCVRGRRSRFRQPSSIPIARLSRPPLGRPLNPFLLRSRSILSSRATPGGPGTRGRRVGAADVARMTGASPRRGRPLREGPGVIVRAAHCGTRNLFRRRGTGRERSGHRPIDAGCPLPRGNFRLRRPGGRFDRVLRSGARFQKPGYMVGPTRRGAPPGPPRRAGSDEPPDPDVEQQPHRDEVGDHGAAAVGDEGQRNAGDRHDPHGHADVHEHLHGEHGRDAGG